MTTKEKVLEILTQNMESPSPVSGEKLAETCGVSRAAIWKAVNALRQQGYPIEGATNGGYFLKGQGDIFSQELVQQYLKKHFPAFSTSHIETFSEIDSTNTYAKRILSECGNLRDTLGNLTPAGTKYHKSIIIAESQTAGRGRLGRTFYSPAKTGIYLSIIYAPEGGIQDPAKLTVYSAVAVCRAIQKLYNITPSIKWINDIFINGKKVSGILTEGFANFEIRQIESAIIGIGINISDNPDIFPPEVAKIAGSITGNQNDYQQKNQESVLRYQLAAQVAGEVLTIFEQNHQTVMKEYKMLSFLIGKNVEVHPLIGDDKSNYDAKVIDIDDNAGLVVQMQDGTTKILNSGEVSLHSENFNKK